MRPTKAPLLLLVLPALAALPSLVFGRGSGVIEGEFGIPKNVTKAFPACGFCHGTGFPNERGKVTVVVSSPRSLTVGATIQATVSLKGGVPNSSRGGFSMDSDAGLLIAGTNTRTGNSGRSITHKNSLSRSWTFSFKGTQAGLVRWTIAGNTANGDGRNTGDSWGWFGPDSSKPGVPYRLFVNATGVQAFGQACAGTAGFRPLAGIATSPLVGGSFKLKVHEIPPATAVLAFLGFSNKSWGALPLPLPLTAFGAPGCALLASMDIVQIAFSTGTGAGNGAAAATWVIPNDSRLRGLQLHFQALVVDKGANRLGLTASNGVTATLR